SSSSLENKMKYDKKLVWLKNRHKKLDEEINLFRTKNYLTPDDEITIQEMKKEKLICKDKIHKLAANA
ncbi:MAG: YdcH family protein, partial [Bdellovibrionales bacterium]|nr:YdcH family protein [Bdellovibrionales bacterium]